MRWYCWILGVACVIAGARPAHARDGHEVYAQNCAACHGDDGRGRPAREADFPVATPDFTDCNFGTPEANADWLATVHLGGLARGFDRRMPAFQEALTEQELSAVVQYLRHFCTDPSWPRGELNLPRPFFTEKPFPEDEAVLTVAGARSNVTSTLNYEKRFGARSQLEVTVPVVYAQQDAGGWAGGVGDVAIGLKRVIFTSLASGSILTLAGEIAVPTGRHDRGFGAGTMMTEGSVMAAQLVTSTVFVQAHAGIGFAWDRTYPDEAFGRGVIGDQLIPVRYGRMFAPMLEVTVSRELENTAQTDVDVIPELQITLSARQHIRAAAGVDVPVTDRTGREVTGLVYFLWDIADGTLTEGW